MKMRRRWKDESILPGFGLSIGYTLLYISLIVLFPLAGVLLKSMELSWREFWDIVTSPRVVAAYKVSIGSALFAALANMGIGLLVDRKSTRLNSSHVKRSYAVV